MEGLTKKQIKMIAALHAAIHIRNTDVYMFDANCNATNIERLQILEEIYAISVKLSKGAAMNLGTTEDIIKYVRKNY